MKRGIIFVITSDIWAGIANLSIPDLMQVIASCMAIGSSLIYLSFYIYDKIKNKKPGG